VLEAFFPGFGGLAGLGFLRRRDAEEKTAPLEILTTLGVGEQPVISDPDEAIGQGMHQEAADEFDAFEAHHALLAVSSVVLVGKVDAIVLDRVKPVVGNGRAMGVAPAILEPVLAAAKRRLGEDIRAS